MVFCHRCLFSYDSDCVVSPVIKVDNTTANVPTASQLLKSYSSCFLIVFYSLFKYIFIKYI